MTDDTTLARNFKALAHPRRARIFRLLAERPEVGRSFQHLQQATMLHESSLVHHLREMERCGILRRHRNGPCVAYILETAGLTGAIDNALSLCRRAHRPARKVA